MLLLFALNAIIPAKHAQTILIALYVILLNLEHLILSMLDVVVSIDIMMMDPMNFAKHAIINVKLAQMVLNALHVMPQNLESPLH
jgi:hypothetical protein